MRRGFLLTGSRLVRGNGRSANSRRSGPALGDGIARDRDGERVRVVITSLLVRDLRRDLKLNRALGATSDLGNLGDRKAVRMNPVMVSQDDVLTQGCQSFVGQGIAPDQVNVGNIGLRGGRFELPLDLGWCTNLPFRA